MAYLRFVIAKRDPDSGVAAGIFTAAYELRDADATPQADRNSLAEQIAWFKKNLAIPTRFNRSSSKGYYRKSTKGISWFRDDAFEFLSRMHEIKRILEANGQAVHILREDRIGYVVYEDGAQVVAEPFSDTRTSA